MAKAPFNFIRARTIMSPCQSKPISILKVQTWKRRRGSSYPNTTLLGANIYGIGTRFATQSLSPILKFTFAAKLAGGVTSGRGKRAKLTRQTSTGYGKPFCCTEFSRCALYTIQNVVVLCVIFASVDVVSTSWAIQTARQRYPICFVGLRILVLPSWTGFAVID